MDISAIRKLNKSFLSQKKLEKVITDVESRDIVTDIKTVKAELLQAYAGIKPASKKVTKTVEQSVKTETPTSENIVSELKEEVATQKRGRGRPKGSKNKPKLADEGVASNIPQKNVEDETIELISNNLPKNYKYVSHQTNPDGTIRVNCKLCKRGRHSEGYTVSANTTFVIDPKKTKAKAPQKPNSAEEILSDTIKDKAEEIKNPSIMYNGKLCYFPNQVVPSGYKLSHAYQSEKDANSIFLNYTYIGAENPNAKETILVKANLSDLVEKKASKTNIEEVVSKPAVNTKNSVSKALKTSTLSDEEIGKEFDKLCSTEEIENLILSNENLFRVVVDAQKTRDRSVMTKFLDTFHGKKEGFDYKNASDKFVNDIHSQESERVANKMIREILNPQSEAENSLVGEIQKAFGDKIASGKWEDIINVLNSYNAYKNMPSKDKAQILKIMETLQKDGNNEQISWLLGKIVKNEYVNVDTVIPCVQYAKNSYGERIVSGQYGNLVFPARVKKEMSRKNLTHLFPKFEEAMKTVVPSTGHSGVKLNTSGGTTDWIAEVKLVDSKYRLRSIDGVTFDKLVEKKTNRS